MIDESENISDLLTARSGSRGKTMMKIEEKVKLAIVCFMSSFIKNSADINNQLLYMTWI